jgi:hypothetical protein
MSSLKHSLSKRACFPNRLLSAHVAQQHNNTLVPTRKGEAPLLAAQRGR